MDNVALQPRVADRGWPVISHAAGVSDPSYRKQRNSRVASRVPGYLFLTRLRRVIL
jgi:hypothetical protein